MSRGHGPAGSDCCRLRPRFFSLVEARQYSWGLEEQRELLRSMLMTAADLAASAKPWHVQERVARLVTAELVVQGDKERQQLNIEPQALMDRERQHELPRLQLRWLADVCLPLYKVCQSPTFSHDLH
jgi:dual 3',5'-cyclic-AMP and -GMP phosphodiesterase 11